MTFASAVVLLFLVIDPFGNVPFFVAALHGIDPGRRRRVLIRELLIAWAVTAMIVLLGSRVAARLGPRGLVAIERLMGMILVAVAIQMFLTGAEIYFSRRG